VCGASNLQQDNAAIATTVDLDETPILMSAPMVFIGAGSLGLLGATVNDLIFTNTNTETDAKVTILAVRDSNPAQTQKYSPFPFCANI